MAKANALTIDIPYLVGRDPRIVELCELDQRRYLALWGLAGELGSELLPEVYNLTKPHQLSEAIHIGRGRSLELSCREMVKLGLILTGPLHDLCSEEVEKERASCKGQVKVPPTLTRPLHDHCRIVVVGLGDRYPARSIKIWDEAARIGLVRIGLVCSTKEPAASPRSDKSQEVATENGQNPDTIRTQDGKPFNTEGFLIGKFRAAWIRRFGHSRAKPCRSRKRRLATRRRRNL
jgi:hypothetical protein